MAGTGQRLSYDELDRRSNQLAHLLWDAGLRRGDHVAVFMENHLHYLEVVWAALRSGLYLTAVNSYLSPDEVGYILQDCGATALVTSRARAEVARAAVATEASASISLRLMVDGPVDGFDEYEAALAHQPQTPIPQESVGTTMLYSSGTTGRPKGVLRPLPDGPVEAGDPRVNRLLDTYGYDPDMVYLSPAPLYHAAPLTFSVAVHRAGGTLVVMERFDPVDALAAIERHQVTHSQWVPTMFVRMLKLAPDQRRAHDLSSHRVAIHAAAPCPVEVKRRMIEWWGPILWEYYAGTEGNGSTLITSQEWLAKPGSVGRCRLGRLHIVGDDGRDLPPGEVGAVFFSGGGEFAYHNDPAKTAAARLPGGRSTLGDVGYVDEDGYLFLTDRKAFMIISGGVNIYPQEVEDCLVLHPAVADVAVFGVPDEEMGEAVKAVVQPAAGVEAGPELERALLGFARERIAHYKAPRSVDFVAELPRLPTGKLYKRLLRDRYWGRTDTTVA
jgi:long-chain acyl-CoA synthetase